MNSRSSEFVGPTPQPTWEGVRPSLDQEVVEWTIEEIGINFTATPASGDAGRWDVHGTDAEGHMVSYKNSELLRDPENHKRLDIVREFVSKHKKELVIGIAGGAAVAMAGKGVVAFQKHRAK